MKGLRKSKRVSWAPGGNLRQVKLFLSEDSPSQVGLDAQDHLQAKSSWLSQSSAANDDALPPGFEGAYPANQLQIKLSEVFVKKWRCPSKFVLNSDWQVVAGEESEEVEVQNQREIKLLETFYPSADIPSNPIVSVEVANSHHNDQQTLLIPITPIEDEDAMMETSSDFTVSSNIPMSSHSLIAPGFSSSLHCSMPGIPNTLGTEIPTVATVPNVEPDIAAAASAALTAITKSNEHGNLIDQELLIKILSNPKMLEKLAVDYGTASSAQNTPKPTSPFVHLSELQSHVTSSDPSTINIHRAESSAPPVAATSSGAFYPQSNGIGVGSLPNTRVPPQAVIPGSCPPAVGIPHAAKDVSYYKNLIQQHGGDRQEPSHQFSGRYNHQMGANQEIVNNLRPRDSKPKIMKPCIYFNSSRGCRHGANCAYQHDSSSHQRANNISEVQSAKRMKLDREISS